MLSPFIESSLAEVEDVSALQLLFDKHARLSTKCELEGDYEAAASHDLTCERLSAAIDAIRSVGQAVSSLPVK